MQLDCRAEGYECEAVGLVFYSGARSSFCPVSSLIRLKGWRVVVCCAGAGFLLWSEGARLTDEERAGSSGDHPTEPALDGREPAPAPEMALTEVLCSAPAPGRQRGGGGVFHQDNSSVCTIVGLCLQLPLHRPEYN